MQGIRACFISQISRHVAAHRSQCRQSHIIHIQSFIGGFIHKRDTYVPGPCRQILLAVFRPMFFLSGIVIGNARIQGFRPSKILYGFPRNRPAHLISRPLTRKIHGNPILKTKYRFRRHIQARTDQILLGIVGKSGGAGKKKAFTSPAPVRIVRQRHQAISLEFRVGIDHSPILWWKIIVFKIFRHLRPRCGATGKQHHQKQTRLFHTFSFLNTNAFSSRPKKRAGLLDAILKICRDSPSPVKATEWIQNKNLRLQNGYRKI